MQVQHIGHRIRGFDLPADRQVTRTIQEPFIDFHEDLLFTDIALFNPKLTDWLVAYNTLIPHHATSLLSTVQGLLTNHPSCQRDWTTTVD